MKVAYLISEYPKVSHSFIRREILALERQGIQVLRIAVRGWDIPLVDRQDIAEKGGTRYVLREGAIRLLLATLMTAILRPFRFFAALALAIKLAKTSDRSLPYHLMYLVEACQVAIWLRSFEADHLHAHFGTNPAEVAMFVHMLSGIPYSFTVHGADEMDRMLIMGIQEKVMHSAFVVAVCSFGRSQLFRWIPLDQWPKVKLVHCGIEKAFHDIPASDPPRNRRLVCVGRLCKEKGQLLLVQAAAILAREGVEFEMVLAGDGELRTTIEALIESLGVQRHFRITGWLTSAQVREEMLAARAMVLPSFTEGLPVVVMEAMALRRPVLSTFVGGIPELVVQGETGWLFPAGEVDELARSLKECLETPIERLTQMGELASVRALARHDADIEAGKLASLFRESAMPKIGSKGT